MWPPGCGAFRYLLKCSQPGQINKRIHLFAFRSVLSVGSQLSLVPASQEDGSFAVRSDFGKILLPWLLMHSGFFVI